MSVRVSLMKQLIPVIALTTLTAATFADAAAPAPAAAAAPSVGLCYNRVGISRSGQDNSLSVSGFLGSSNVLVNVETNSGTAGLNTAFSSGKTSGDTVSFSVGYVFKNVYSDIDAAVSIGSGNQAVGSSFSVNLRRGLNEILSGLEVAVGYKEQKYDADQSVIFGSSGGKFSAWTYEIAYNINKQFSVAYALTAFGNLDGINFAGPNPKNVNTVSIRYNY